MAEPRVFIDFNKGSMTAPNLNLQFDANRY